MKLKGSIELFDIAFGVFIGYSSFKGTDNLVASIVIGVLMIFAMSSFKMSFKNKKEN